MKTKLNFSRRKYGRDHISFVQFVINVFIQGLCGFSMVIYKDFKNDFVTKATYDGKVYVCMACHKSIMKKELHVKLFLIS